MSTTEERLASLEARVDQMGELRTLIVELRQDMHSRFDQVDKRFEQVDRQFEQVDRQFDQVAGRFGQVDGQLGRLESRLDRLDDKVDRHFTWIVGIQMTFFIALIAVLVRDVFR